MVMVDTEKDAGFMRLALVEAARAGQLGEVPIGAVLVKEGKVVGRGHNLRELSNDPTTHAEMIAIREAAEHTGHWRLLDCTLYVTLEPCVMCMGAIILARIPRLVFGCPDQRVGAAGSLYDFSRDQRFNHRVEVTPGVLAEECRAMLTGFFQDLREQKKKGRNDSGPE